MELKKNSFYKCNTDLQITDIRLGDFNFQKDVWIELFDFDNTNVTVNAFGQKIVFSRSIFEKNFLNVELVNHPKHYGGDTEYECIKVLKAWLSPEEYKGFLRGNAIKYLCRTGKKDDVKQELNKAAWYINKLLEEY